MDLGAYIGLESLLEMKEDEMNGACSEGWRFPWSDSRSFIFKEKSWVSDIITSFVAFVHNALSVPRGDHPLHKFHVNFFYNNNETLSSDVDSWLQYACVHKVKDIALVLRGSYYESRDSSTPIPLEYTLPQSLYYSNTSLTLLRLHGCIVAPPTTVEWPSLTKLTLWHVNLSNEAIENIASGAPLLENLELQACWGFNCLDFLNSLAFRTLTLNLDYYRGVPLMCIMAPTMREFNFSVQHNKLRLISATSLEKATVNFDLKYFDDCRFSRKISDQVMSDINEIFLSIAHVRHLVLSPDCVKGLSMMATNTGTYMPPQSMDLKMIAMLGWHLPQSIVEHLEIHAEDDVRSIAGIVALLQSSPQLKILKIYGHVPQHEEVPIRWDRTREYADLNCQLLHLKSVDIGKFRSRELVSRLAQILLKRATTLENMDIQF